MSEQETQDALRDDLRTAWHRYVDLIAPHRPALHGYCRRLSGNVWDAEDLVQDTLLRAFGQWGVSYGEVRNPRAYLFRAATNVWIDLLRRRRTESRDALIDPDDAASPDAGPEVASHVRNAGSRLLARLSPQERAAVVLKEAFDMTLDEIADLLATTTGAVKAALHRGRGRLREEEGGPASRRRLPSVQLVDRFVELVAAEDVNGLLDLLLDGATTENPGNSIHLGKDPAEGMPDFLHAVVHGHKEWPARFQPESSRVVRVEFEGEPIGLALRTYPGREESLTSLYRFEEEDGRIARLRSYAFCPETLREVGDVLGVPVVTGLYRAPTPAPGARWPDEGRR